MKNENQNIEYKETWPMPIVEEMDGGVLAVMKRFTIDEVIARRKGDTAETDNEVGNLSGTCRELN